ncbi:hypothetical protein EVJ58_g10120 [Rhodofomes roseus]|uniref:Integrase catalytic domain-containing protein n=1 Tax=Rhodofomes roseus TaxID=34475 RepID=A0A4Y9XR64_9APHY|nr:hypothetical protein EVJ58_g10120 [Rhodofomes roseus]
MSPTSVPPPHRTISIISIPSSLYSESSGVILDRAKNNWFEWKSYIERHAKMCHLWPYLTGTITRPDPAVDHSSAFNFDDNNAAAVAFLGVKAIREEQVFMDDYTSASELWAALCARHEKEPGAYAQSVLLQELFACRYVAPERFAVTTMRIRETVQRIFRIGLPTEEALTIIAMMNAMGGHLHHLQSQVATALAASSAAAPYTSVDIIKRLDMEQRIIDGNATTSSTTSDALIATKGKPKFTPRVCTNPGCPNPNGHLAATCFAPGGGMFGKRDEYMAAKKARRDKGKTGVTTAAVSSSGSSSTSSALVCHVDQDGRTVVLDKAAGRAYFVSSEPTPSAYISDGEDSANLASDVAPDWLAAVATSADIIEYQAMVCLTPEDKVSLNWGSHSRASVDPLAYHVTLVLVAARRIPTAGTEPFVFDSGASSHLSPNKQDFYELRPIAPRGIRGVSGSVIHAYGVGKVRLHVGRGTTIVLDDVLYVPQATVRLISISALCNSAARYAVHFEGKEVQITKPGGALVASGTLTSRRLYSLNGTPPLTEHSYVATRLPTLDTWHRRLGHVNHRTVHDMARLHSAKGMPISLSPAPAKCEHCILGKQTRSAVPKVRVGERATRKLGLVYVDLQGAMDVRSASGNVYSLDIIDDFSSRSWALPIPSKDSAEARFEAWANTVEAETGLRIGAVQIDNGELLSNEFKTFLGRRGISLRQTAPYTSAHNGRVERLHRTLMDRARAMRLAASVPANRWDDFLLTANYLSVRTPSRSLPAGVTPYEMWYGRKPDLSHLREIGCRVFVLIQNRHNPKIYERSVECTLIGYGENSKTYRCYHRDTHKVVNSYHVAFIESHEATPTVHTAPATPVVASPIGVAPTPAVLPVDDDPVAPGVSSSAGAAAPWPEELPPPVAPVAPPPAVVAPVVVPAPAVPPRRSSRIPVPSQRRAEADGLPFESQLQRTVDDIRSRSRARVASGIPAPVPGPDPSSSIVAPAVLAEPPVPSAFVVNDPPPLLEPTVEDHLEALAAAEVIPLDVEYPGDPATLDEAMASPFRDQWTASLQDEFKSIKDLGVYKLVPRSSVPAGRRILKGKPVFRLKRNEKGEPVRFKSRWCAKGFQQVYGLDYNRTSSPTMRMESFRVLLHLASSLGWEIEQLDVKTAFLHGILPEDEHLYMEQPKGFEEPGKESWVWELVRGIYGTKQGGRTWNDTLNEYLLSIGFTRLSCEHCIYYRTNERGTVLTGVHVDDFLLTASTSAAKEEFKEELRRKWAIADLGEARFCIGIQIDRDRASRSVAVSQTALIDKIIKEFRMDGPDCAPMSTPMDAGLRLSRTMHAPKTQDEKDRASRLPYRSLIGCLMYLAIGTRPDIALAVQQLSQFLDCYGSIHWDAAKRVVRYLKGTRTLRLVLGGADAANLNGYADASHAGCYDTRRSVGGYCWNLGSGIISWAARKQPTVSTSTTEAEYIASCESAKEAVWLRFLLDGIGFTQPVATVMRVDSTSAMSLSTDSTFHARVKHVDIKWHYLREVVAAKKLALQHVPGHLNVADAFTKPLERKQFLTLRARMGLRLISEEESSG